MEEKRALARLLRHARRTRMKGLPFAFTRTHELFMQNYWGHACAICGTPADFWHVIAWDHWIPVSDQTCPGTVPFNILPLCHGRKGARTLSGPRACNNAKQARDPVVWLTERLGPRKAKAKLREIQHYFEAVTALEPMDI
jgi:hypothetical protein